MGPLPEVFIQALVLPEICYILIQQDPAIILLHTPFQIVPASNSVTGIIRIENPVKPVLYFQDEICIDNGKLLLTGGLPVGGSYSGTGITDGFFDPALAGAGIHQIKYAYGSGSCADSTEENIIVNPKPIVGLSSQANLCENFPGKALSGGTPSGGSYSGAAVYDNIFYPSIIGPGMGIITYTYKDTNGCANTAQTTISVKPLPEVSFYPVPNICQGTAPLLINTVTPVGGNFTGQGIYNNMFYPDSVSPGSYFLTYTSTIDGCSSYANQIITINAKPEISITPFDTICISDKKHFLTEGFPAGGTWSGTGVVNNIFNASLAGSGNHLLTYSYTDQKGCSASATAVITTGTQIAQTPLITGKQVICPGEITTLKADGGSDFLWSTGESGDSISVNPISSTVYIVTSVSECGSATNYFTVNVYSEPVIVTTGDTLIPAGSSIKLISTGGVKYAWSPPDGLSCISCSSPMAKPDKSTQYIVMVTDENGCESSNEVTIAVDQERVVYVANIFTPDKDGNNDILYIQGRGIKSIDFSIYNRWGNRVFATDDMQKGWDGTYNGEELNTGTYIYYLKAIFYNDEAINKKGDITLLRK